jgi:hypothetical protein
MPGPRELGACVDQDITKQSSVAFLQGRFDLDVGAKKTHVVGHGTSGRVIHYCRIIAGRVK